MADHRLAELMKTQKSLTEWLEDIKHRDATIVRQEDNNKRERLRQLHDLIGLPFDKPVQFEATDLSEKTSSFVTYLAEHGHETCALRLIPKQLDLPKLRMRGRTVNDAYTWFLEQPIDPALYRVDFMPHCDENIWSTVFIVNKHGIQGEIIAGGVYQLTLGFHDTGRPIVFQYKDFKHWTIEPHDMAALEHLKELVHYIHVPDPDKQASLKHELGATFAHDYLKGYFETVYADRYMVYRLQSISWQTI